MKLIRFFDRQRDFSERFTRTVEWYNEQMASLFRVKAFVQPLIEFLGVVSLAGILIAGSFFVLQEETAGAGLVLAFVLISFRLLSPMIHLNHAVTAISGYLPYYAEVCTLLSKSDKPFLANGTRLAGTVSQGIEFRGVTFAYSAERGVVLENISLVIPNGGKLGIVGSLRQLEVHPRGVARALL